VVDRRVAEDAGQIDLRQQVRDLVARIERDLGTGLESVAIDHHNTDDDHVHPLIRGLRDDTRTLKLDRDYVRRGIRGLSEELIERELGPRRVVLDMDSMRSRSMASRSRASGR
jgi:type IV secretory pathway VirD2 relaxase